MTVTDSAAPTPSTPTASTPTPGTATPTSNPKGGLDTATLDLPGWQHVYSGKVRDLYVPADAVIPERFGQDCVLVVASDRISAYDHVLASEIPDKGRILTQLSLWWFEQLGVAHHVLASTVDGGVPAAVEGRAMICKKLDMFPVECIARGYLTGSGLLEYRSPAPCAASRCPPAWLTGRGWRKRSSRRRRRQKWASMTRTSPTMRSLAWWARTPRPGCAR